MRIRTTRPSTTVALFLAALWSTPGAAFSPAKPPPPGWHGEVKFGAHATGGSSRSKQVHASTELSYSGERVENHFTLSFSRTASTLIREDTDEHGKIITDAAGRARMKPFKAVTFDRRFIGMQPHWYWSERSYLMSIIDWESNEPKDIKTAARVIVGMGHKLWNNRYDMLVAEVGAGEKHVDRIESENTNDPIGYLGMKFVRDLSERTRASFEMDSDFGSDNQFTEFKLGLRYKLTRMVAITFRFASRINTDITEPSNPLDSDADSESAIYLEVDVF